MKVKANFYCPDIIGELRSGDYEIPEGSTVQQLFNAAEAEAGVSYGEDVTGCLNLLLNNCQAQWDTVVTDGSTLRVLFKFYGG